MVAQETVSNDSAAMPSPIPAAHSPVITPTREGGPKKKSGSARTRRKRLSPEENSASMATVSQELFGDFMSIEEIAAQTEKAYQSRKLNVSQKTAPKIPHLSSSSRLRIPGSPKNSKAKKSLSKSNLPSTKKTYSIFVLAAVLPFLLCESFLLVLTLQYRDHSFSEINSSSEDRESLLHLKLDNTDRKVESVDLVDLADNFEEQNNDAVNRTCICSTINCEMSNADDETLRTSHSTSTDCGCLKCTNKEEHQLKEDGPDAGVSKHAPLEIRTIQHVNETNEFDILDYVAMLDEAFSMIAASKLTSAIHKEIENLLSAETLCKNVLSRVRDALTLETDKFGRGDKTFDVGATDSSYNAHSLKFLEFKSQLCIGRVKMSTTSDEVDSMLQEATNAFQHLAHLDPYSLGAQAGLGTSMLAQGLLNANYSSHLDNYKEARVSLLTLATFHLKLASSLCLAPRGQVDRVIDGMHFSSDVTVDGASINAEETGQDKHLRQFAYAAILHNLALAYVALGDSKSSVPLLLRAAAIQRQVGHQTNAFYWNLPDVVLQQMEEKAWLLGAQSDSKKQKKKRRIPFVPDTFTFDELLDGI